MSYLSTMRPVKVVTASRGVLHLTLEALDGTLATRVILTQIGGNKMTRNQRKTGETQKKHAIRHAWDGPS